MCRRAVADRQQHGALSRQTTFLEHGDRLADPPPEDSPIKLGRERSPRKSANATKPALTFELAEQLTRIEQRLTSLESLLNEVHERSLNTIIKEYYTTQEVAKLLKKRPYTVREWCRLGRVRGEKSHAGRGLDEEWRISHEELTRIQNEGLLPLQKFTQVDRPRRLK